MYRKIFEIRVIVDLFCHAPISGALFVDVLRLKFAVKQSMQEKKVILACPPCTDNKISIA